MERICQIKHQSQMLALIRKLVRFGMNTMLLNSENKLR